MQAIQTKYHGPTDHSGSRITARCDAKRITVPYDHALDVAANHRQAAITLAFRLGWVTAGVVGTDVMVSGSLPDGSYAHCLIWK